MDLDSIKGNSNAQKKADAKKEEKEISPVAHGKRAKSSPIRKMSRVIFRDPEEIKHEAVIGIILPGLLNFAHDTLSDILDLIFKDEVSSMKKSKIPKVSYMDYGKASKKHSKRDDEDYYSYSQSIDTKVMLDTRVEAEEVLEAMTDILERYEVVSVFDYFDICGVDGEFTDNKYGWTDEEQLVKAPIRRTRSGYFLDLPRPMPLD